MSGQKRPIDNNNEMQIRKQSRAKPARCQLKCNEVNWMFCSDRIVVAVDVASRAGCSSVLYAVLRSRCRMSAGMLSAGHRWTSHFRSWHVMVTTGNNACTRPQIRERANKAISDLYIEHERPL